MATVIRNSPPHEQSSDRALRAVAFRFEDMAHQADSYLDKVRGEATRIIHEAHGESARIRQEAAEAGRQAAMQAVERILDEKVAQQMKTLMPALDRAVREIEDAKHAWLEHWEKATVALAAAIAARIIRRELTEQPEIPLGLIQEALSLAAGAEKITLHISAVDHQNLGPQIEQLIQAVAQLAPTQIIPDETLEPGGCRVTTAFGEIDQRIESQLNRIVEELTG